MKKVFLISLFAFLGICESGFGQMKLEIWLVPEAKTIPCVPIELHVAWQNISKDDLRIGPPLVPTASPSLRISLNGSLRSLPLAPVRYREDAPSVLKPGERIEGITGLPFPDMKPGVYQVKAIADFHNRPEGYFHGVVASNTVDLTILSPSGEDLNAWNNSLTDQFGLDKEPPLDQRWRICISLQSPDILSRYPTSTYAAYAFGNLCGLGYPTEQRLNLDQTRSILETLLHGDLNRLVTKNETDGSTTTTGEGTTAQVTRKEWLMTMIDRAQVVCSPHPNLDMCDRIGFHVMAWHYLELLQFDQANAILRRLSEKAVAPTLREDSKQLLTLVRELRPRD